ncbi:MAG: hypothetical protein K2I56_03160 [Muribaculaceae bacterium]|nr:hypothetical protein [Muribaculaceae bacterium]
MKKLYTMLMAAGVSAVACSAAAPVSITTGKAMEAKTLESVTFGTGQVLSVNSGSKARKAPAMAAGMLPNLTNSTLAISYYYGNDQVQYDNDNLLDFTLEETDDDGNQLYTMTGFLEGSFNETVTVNPGRALYNSNYGELQLVGGEKGLLSADGDDFDIYMVRNEDGRIYGLPLIFEYNGDGFTFVKVIENFEFKNDQGQIEVGTFTVKDIYLGCPVVENGQNVLSWMCKLTDLDIRMAQGKMQFTADTYDKETGAVAATVFSSALYTDLTGGILTVQGFGSPILNTPIPFTVDTKAKTLTADGVQVGTGAQGPMFLSQADPTDNWNIYEEEEAYRLVCTYTCSGGKTEVTVPQWNCYCYNSGTMEDEAQFVPLYSSTMTFSYNLDQLVAGVGNITVDEADENAPVEYYNLQGVRVQNPENGLYIRRQGKNVTKVIL